MKLVHQIKIEYLIKMGNFCCKDNKEKSPVKQNERTARRDNDNHKRTYARPVRNNNSNNKTSNVKMKELELKPARF